MNAPWLVVAAVGGATLAGSVAGARRVPMAAAERAVFRAVNGLPSWLYWFLWAPMQLGNLVVGCGAGLAIAWMQHDVWVAVGVVLATILKLVVERAVRSRLASAGRTSRQRPGTSQPGAILRGDVPSSGPSFPSGHVILVAGIACVVLPSLPFGWQWVPVAATAAVMSGRVYVGAHNPLDTSAGLGAGMILGGAIAALTQ